MCEQGEDAKQGEKENKQQEHDTKKGNHKTKRAQRKYSEESVSGAASLLSNLSWQVRRHARWQTAVCSRSRWAPRPAERPQANQGCPARGAASQGWRWGRCGDDQNPSEHMAASLAVRPCSRRDAALFFEAP